jgi:hypothetical protein
MFNVGGLMFSSIKGVITGALAALVAILAVGAAVSHLQPDHGLEIQLLQNARIGEGHTRATGSGAASTAQPPGAAAVSSQTAKRVPSEEILSLGYTLMSDERSQTRGEIADKFGRWAAQSNSGSTEFGAQEAQMIDLLQSAYHREKDPGVRCKIVASGAAFNHPQAAVLIELAAQDPDASVRQSAQEARRSREARLTRYGTADFRPAGSRK